MKNKIMFGVLAALVVVAGCAEAKAQCVGGRCFSVGVGPVGVSRSVAWSNGGGGTARTAATKIGWTSEYGAVPPCGGVVSTEEETVGRGFGRTEAVVVVEPAIPFETVGACDPVGACEPVGACAAVAGGCDCGRGRVGCGCAGGGCGWTRTRTRTVSWSIGGRGWYRR